MKDKVMERDQAKREKLVMADIISRAQWSPSEHIEFTALRLNLVHVYARTLAHHTQVLHSIRLPPFVVRDI